MQNSFIDWLHKKAQQVAAPIEQHVIQPVENAATHVANAVHNNVIQPIQRDIVQPIEHTPNYLPDVQHAAQWAGNEANNIFDSTAKPLAQIGPDIAIKTARLIQPHFGVKPYSAQQFGSLPTSTGHLIKESGATGSTGQLASDIGQAGLMVATGSANGLVDNAGEQVLKSAAPKVVKAVAKPLLRAGVNAGLGSAFNTLSLGTNGQQFTKQNVEHAAKVGAITGGALSLGADIAAPLAKAASDVVATNAPKAVAKLHNVIQGLSDINKRVAMKAATEAKPVQSLSLDSLTSHEGAPDTLRVQQYKNAIQNGQKVEPIIAMRDSSGNLGIEDGKHRFEAYRQLGVKQVPVKIVTPQDIHAIAQGGYVRIGKRPAEGTPPINEGEQLPSSDIYQTGENLSAVRNDRKSFAPLYDKAMTRPKSLTPAEVGQLRALYDKYNPSLPFDRAAMNNQGSYDLHGAARSLWQQITDQEIQHARRYAKLKQAPVIQHEQQISQAPVINSDTMEPQHVSDVIKWMEKARQPRSQMSGIALSRPTATVGTAPLGELDKEAYARAFDLPRYQVEKDFADMAKDRLYKRGMSRDELKNLGPQQRLSVQRRRELIATDPRQATQNNVELSPVPGSTKSAIAQAEGLSQEAESRLLRAEELGNKLAPEDKALLYSYDAGTPITDLVKQAKNPTQFENAAHALSDALDYDLAVRRSAGEATLRQPNYVPHHYAVSEEWMNTHKIPEDQRIKVGKDVKGYRDVSAKYPSYLEAHKRTNGVLQPLYSSPVEDLAQYRNGGMLSRRNNLLAMALAKARPDDIASLDTTRIGENRLTQAAGQLPFSVTDAVQKDLKAYQRSILPSNVVTGTVGKLLRHGNSLAKRVLFFGTPFHYMNEQASFVGKNLLNPKNLAKGEVRFIQTIATKGGYQRLIDAARADGTLEAVRKMGVMLPEDSRLNRASSAFSLTEAQDLLKRGLDPNSDKAWQLGQQINHLMGHRNLAVEGVSPTQARFLSLSTLAPHWTTTQLQLVKDALVKWRGAKGAAGSYARGSILGKRAALGLTGVGGSILLSHHLPTLSQALNEFGLTPQNPVPNIELNSHNKRGEAQEMVTPTDPLGLAVGLATNPSHFVQSRLSPGLSFLTKIATNQNWNSEPLAEGPHNVDYYINLIKNAALNSGLPIGVQNLTNFTNNQNNPSLLQGLAEEFGGRLKTDPNDPAYVATQQYYKALSDATNTLVPNSPEMGAFLESFGPTKDPTTGKYIMTPNSEMTVAKSASLNAFPAANAAANLMARQLLKNGQNVDPYYLLTPSQQKAYNAYETMAPLSADRTDWQDQNKAWFPAFQKKQQAFFNSLPPSDPSKPKNPIQYPKFDNQTNSDLNTYYALTDSTARGTFLNNHPNVVDALNATFTYDNAVRNARGYESVKPYPTASHDVQQFMNTYDAASKAERKGLRTANPDMYRSMIDYFDNLDLYSINKDGALGQFVDQPDSTNNELKDIKSLSQDVVQTGTDANGKPIYAVVPAAWMSGYGSSSSSWTPDATYDQLHFLTHRAKPTIAHLSKGKSFLTPVKASYKSPRVASITIKPSSISKGKRPTLSKRKVLA